MEELKVILKLLDLLEFKQWKKKLKKTNGEEFKDKIELETNGEGGSSQEQLKDMKVHH